MNLESVLTGISAVFLSGILSIILVFIIYKIDLMMTRKIDEEQHMLDGRTSISIVLGSVLLSQAMLVRHAVHPVMTVIRTGLVNRLSQLNTLSVLGHSLLYIIIMGSLSVLITGMAIGLFSLMNRRISHQEEVLKDNIAVAVFLAFVVLSVTVIIDQGMADLAQSIIPELERGYIRVG